MTDLIGQTINHYQIIERLGDGGMAYVYKAYHPGLDVYRAIKIVRPEFADKPGFKERFQREAQAVAKLRHPHIVQVHDYGAHQSLYYMVMEFVAGQDLKDYLKQHGATRPFSQVVNIVGQVAAALHYAHQQGILHRDIKPANIMLTPRQEVILADFGIAKILQQDNRTESGTEVGVSIGTPAYMAPEQARGLAEVGPAADIYSLGVVLYEMLTGRVPYIADTPLAVIIKVINDPLPPPRNFSADIPDALQAVVLKATAKDPTDRYPNAEAMAEALKRSLTAGPETGTVNWGATVQVAAPPAKRKPPWLWLGLGSLVLVIAALALCGLGYILWPSLPRPEQAAGSTSTPPPSLILTTVPPTAAAALPTTTATPQPDPPTPTPPPPVTPTVPPPTPFLDTFTVLVTVPANSDWVDTGLVVKAEQDLTISASGGIRLSDTQTEDTNPAGGGMCQPHEGSNCPINGAPYGKLLAKIGDNPPFEVGSTLETPAPAGGSLSLAINDNFCCYTDNSGAYEVSITLTRPAEMLLSDDFDNTASNGAWNEEIWNFNSDPNATTIEQNDGFLTISRHSLDVGGLEYGPFMLEDLDFVEAKVMLDGNIDASGGNVGITLWKKGWWLLCGIAAKPEDGSVWAGCWSSDEFKGEWIEVSYDTWHTVRLEVSPDITAISLFVDSRQSGVYPIPAPDEFKQTQLKSDIRVWSAGGSVTGYIDDAKLGRWLNAQPPSLSTPIAAIDADPAIYDNFDNPAHDGKWDERLWQPRSEAAACAASQQEGFFNFTCPNATNNPRFDARGFTNAALKEIDFVEAKLMLSQEETRLNNGNVMVGMRGDSGWGVDCGIIEGGAEQITAYSFCYVFPEKKFITGLPVAYNEWHTIKIEFSSDEAQFKFLIDGVEFDTYPLADKEMLNQIFSVYMGVNAESESMTGYIDDVRIGQ